MNQQPLVSIGITVFNEVQNIRRGLDRILGQDYQNLEIIIADDGSMDGSRQICREYAQKDSRIRYFENRHNLGVIDNHRFVFELSSGDFFTWGYGHDYYHPSFIRKTLEVLLENPSVVMCCSQTVFIDLDGNITSTNKSGFDTRNLMPVERFKSLINFMESGGTANIFHALYRSEILANVAMRKILGTDVILLAELSLLGEMVQVNEVLYYRTKYFETQSDRLERWINTLLNPKGLCFAAIMPYLVADFTYFNVIEESTLSDKDKEELFHYMHNMLHGMERIFKEEINNFIEIIIPGLNNLETYPMLMKFRAAQALDIIGKINMLGLENDEISKIRAVCLSKLKNNQQMLSGFANIWHIIVNIVDGSRIRLRKLYLYFSSLVHR